MNKLLITIVSAVTVTLIYAFIHYGLPDWFIAVPVSLLALYKLLTSKVFRPETATVHSIIGETDGDVDAESFVEPVRLIEEFVTGDMDDYLSQLQQENKTLPSERDVNSSSLIYEPAKPKEFDKIKLEKKNAQ